MISDGLEENKAEMLPGEYVQNEELANEIMQAMITEPFEIKFYNNDVFETVNHDPEMIYKDLCVRYYELVEGEIQ